MNQNGIEERAALHPDPATTPTQERVRSFKGFLATETDRLRARHEFGLGGKEIAQGRSHLVDAVVAQTCRMVADDLGPDVRSELAASTVIALGGYGRQELAPSSDVDLLFLHPGRMSRVAERFVEGVVPLLWDVGLKLGHSVRSVSECVDLAAEDLHVRNAAAEARLLLGSTELFNALQKELLSKVYRSPKANRRFYKAMRAEFIDRREKHGPVIGMLEPNVKEGAGGLRDLHTVIWVGLARYGARGLDGLMAAGVISPTDYGRMLRAYDFLLRVRNEAHFRTGRATDLITLELQPTLAKGLGYSDQGTAAASEIFMRDFYFRAQEIQRFADAFLRQAELTTPPAGILPLTRRMRAVGPERRYRIRGEELLPGPDGIDFEEAPLRLFEVFQVAQQHGVRVGAELKEMVHENLDLVDRGIRHSPEAARAFMALLSPLGRVAATLTEMHETGLLGRFLPEFRTLTFMVQHDYYHRYTVDQHTLKAIEALDDLALDDSLDLAGARASLRDALREVDDTARLVLAVLMHDVGKGQGSGHVVKGERLSKEVCRRLGLDAEASGDVTFLVSKHLVMSRVSQRRDLSDEDLLVGFAETVGTVDRLNMLYLLTFADMSGVAPGVWNEWKAVLLRDLHMRSRSILAGGGPAEEASRRRVRFEEKVLQDLMPEFLRSDVDEFLSHLPDRYMLSVPPDAIARHFEMIRELGTRPFVTDWRQSEKGPYTLFSVCVNDRPGLLASIAGALTGSGLDILSVDIFTRDDGIVLDWFKVSEAAMGSSAVQPVTESRFATIDADLGAALDGTLDLSSAVERQRARQVRRRRRRAATPVVRFERPEVPNGRTVIEVKANDEPGLVYTIAATLADLGMNISLAKIATEKNQALDVFYVSNAHGASLSPGEEAAVERALIEALKRPD
ncbi:MAG: [protein-PII] uridylyltransferase [Gemmatimonadota bacterium]|jgi:[protein-PII] uridylyltransferase